ncbi:MAG: TIGR02996 domain-containing protein [Kofleriaceae bacterium]
MDRASELEAAIAEAPDRREPYLVYADYLLEQGDRRGQLIMMQAAGSGGHVMKELAVRRDDLEQTWFMGFIDTVKITGDRPMFALNDVFEHPSGRFVQQIAIQRETPGLVAFIVERAPKTLARLQIGTVTTATPELLAAFPRMRTGIALADAVKRAEQQKLSTGIPAAKLPAFPDLDTGVVLKGLRAELEKARPIGMLDALKASFAPDTLDAFALALGEQWEQHDQETWAFRALGRLGGDRTVKFLGDRFTQFSHARAVQALELLETIGTPLAITEMAWAWGKITRYRPRREEARRLLEQLADRRGVGNAMELVLRHPPVNAAIGPQRWFLQEMMLQGTQIAAGDFQQFVLGNGVRAGLAKALLWGAYDHGGELVEAFTVDREVREPYVGVIHPIELDKAQRARWAVELPQQPFLQLARPVFDKVSDYTRDAIGRDAVIARLADRDWYVAEQGDRGVVTALARDFYRDGVTCYVMVGDGRLGNVGAQTFHGTTRRLKDLSAVTRSELVLDLEYAIGNVALAPLVDVVVEVAKTSRAKCVVCDQPIAKGTQRVGVERLIQTDKFSGRGMVWAHYDCRDRVPEAAGL